MRLAPGPMPHRLLALLCLCLTLVTALPCTAASLRQPATMQGMAAHCAPCCTPSPAQAAALCCQGHPQSAQPADSASAHEAATQAVRSTTEPCTPCTIAIADTELSHQPAPPPLLHRILRI